MTNVDVLTAPAIASVVFTTIEFVAGVIPARVKPLLALLLGVGWAVAAWRVIPGAYPNVMVAASIGITAGGAAIGVDSARNTYAPTDTPLVTGPVPAASSAGTGSPVLYPDGKPA